MKSICMATAILLAASMVEAQDRGAKPAGPQSVKGRVTAYEAEKSITVESTTRNGEKKTEFAIVKDKTEILLGDGLKVIEAGMTVSVYADKADPKTAARILAPGPSKR